MSSSAKTRLQSLDGLDMARACFDLGDYDEAIALAKAELASGDPTKRYKAVMMIACCESRKGHFDGQCYRPSLGLVESEMILGSEKRRELNG